MICTTGKLLLQHTNIPYVKRIVSILQLCWEVGIPIVIILKVWQNVIALIFNILMFRINEQLQLEVKDCNKSAIHSRCCICKTSDNWIREIEFDLVNAFLFVLVVLCKRHLIQERLLFIFFFGLQREVEVPGPWCRFNMRIICVEENILPLSRMKPIRS